MQNADEKASNGVQQVIRGLAERLCARFRKASQYTVEYDTKL
jgi:hypothetical protein